MLQHSLVELINNSPCSCGKLRRIILLIRPENVAPFSDRIYKIILPALAESSGELFYKFLIGIMLRNSTSRTIQIIPEEFWDSAIWCASLSLPDCCCWPSKRLNMMLKTSVWSEASSASAGFLLLPLPFAPFLLNFCFFCNVSCISWARKVAIQRRTNLQWGEIE